MFFTKRTPKSASARLEQEMASITEQSMSNANAMRKGSTLTQITLANTEALFSEKNASGETVYNHYHFTDDMNQADPEAQVHLMRLFGQIIAFNEMLEHPGVDKRLDWITANASFFERFFARADVSTDIFAKRAENATDSKLRLIKLADKARIKQVLASMFDPDAIASLVPRPTIPFVLAMGKPHEEGQKFINGVYFSAQAAPAVMEWITSLQAQSQQDSNPAHA